MDEQSVSTWLFEIWANANAFDKFKKLPSVYKKLPKHNFTGKMKVFAAFSKIA